MLFFVSVSEHIPMEDDGFELVTHNRKKTKGRKNNPSDKKLRPGCNDLSRPEPISDFKEFTNKFKGVCHEVRESGYFENLKEGAEFKFIVQYKTFFNFVHL